jgi:hypothetical protein
MNNIQHAMFSRLMSALTLDMLADTYVQLPFVSADLSGFSLPQLLAQFVQAVICSELAS